MYIAINFYRYIYEILFQDDEDDYSGPALGGPVRTRSDFSDDDDDDRPVTMRSPNLRSKLAAPIHLNVPISKPSFKMEVFDL